MSSVDTVRKQLAYLQYMCVVQCPIMIIPSRSVYVVQTNDDTHPSIIPLFNTEDTTVLFRDVSLLPISRR